MSKDIDAFVKANLPTAQAVASKIGVDPMVILGQWGLETGWGKSVPGTNNLGNIKGQGVSAKDNQTGSVDQYRAYPTLDAFGKDFGGLIGKMYPGAVNAGPDAVSYATALKKGGYAEDPAYATKLPAAVKSVRDSQGIDIDPSKIQWDAAPTEKGSSAPDISPQIDVGKVQWDSPAPTASANAAPQGSTGEQPGTLESFGANAGKGFGKTMLGAQQLVGEGLKKLGGIGQERTLASLVTGQQPQNLVQRAGNWLVNDAVQGAKNLDAQAAPYSEAHPIAGTIGDITGAVVNPLNRLIPMGGAGNTLASLIGRGAAQGAISGAFTPVQDGNNFWTDKAKQVALGGGIGAAIPAAGAGVKAAGNALGFGANAVSPEVAALAQKAKDQGIGIRADQLVNSKPLNALSAALDYVPFSGKSSAIAAQQKQFNTAVSRTIGENTDNVGRAIDAASTRLGGEFDKVLKNTAVKADTPFQNDLARIVGDAQNEMTEQQFGVIGKQVDNILNKVKPGDVIDADAAYNIKKGLDRISKSNDTTLAYYGREMRNALMDALNRSLPDGGASFAKTRQQWGNLMELQKLLPRGAEGDISAARLANARGIKSQDLGQLADIAGQFLKQRVGDSGTVPRAIFSHGLLGSGLWFDPTSVGVGLTAGRLTNAALGSNALTNAMISRSLSSAALNGGNGALAGQPAQQALVNRLAPYLIPAASVSAAGSSALNKP